jgi:hypothetical protein
MMKFFISQYEPIIGSEYSAYNKRFHEIGYDHIHILSIIFSSTVLAEAPGHSPIIYFPPP